MNKEDNELGKKIRESNYTTYTRHMTLEQIRTKYGEGFTEEQYKLLEKYIRNER